VRLTALLTTYLAQSNSSAVPRIRLSILGLSSGVVAYALRRGDRIAWPLLTSSVDGVHTGIIPQRMKVTLFSIMTHALKPTHYGHYGQGAPRPSSPRQPREQGNADQGAQRGAQVGQGHCTGRSMRGSSVRKMKSAL
jgi:hypothetical protein